MDENIKITLEKQNPWWFAKEFESGIERLQHYPSISKYMGSREILLLVGARRTGKSTLLYQLIKHIIKAKPPNGVLFVNFDEPLFQSKAKDPAFLTNTIMECILEKNIN